MFNYSSLVLNLIIEDSCLAFDLKLYSCALCNGITMYNLHQSCVFCEISHVHSAEKSHVCQAHSARVKTCKFLVQSYVIVFVSSEICQTFLLIASTEWALVQDLYKGYKGLCNNWFCLMYNIKYKRVYVCAMDDILHPLFVMSLHNYMMTSCDVTVCLMTCSLWW